MSQDADNNSIIETSPSVASLAVKTPQKPAAHRLPLELLLHIYRSCAPDPGVVEIFFRQVGSEYNLESSRRGLPSIAATCLRARNELLDFATKEGYRYISRPTLSKPMLLHSHEDIMYFTSFHAFHAFAGADLPPSSSPRLSKQRAIAIGADLQFWQNLSLMSNLDLSVPHASSVADSTWILLYTLSTCSELVGGLMRSFRVPETLYLVAHNMQSTMNQDSNEFMVAEGCVVEIELIFAGVIRDAIDNDHVWARIPQVTFVTRSELDECLNEERAQVLETRF